MTACDYRTLLPRATDTELAIEQEFSEKYCRANPEIIKQLHDPWACPVDFLPWLAFSLSVDVWNDNWPDQTKRSVCDNAISVHKNKGTVGGLEDALSALGVTLEITEWWETSPKGEPGTAVLKIWIGEKTGLATEDGFLIGKSGVNDILRIIESSKRASIHLDFSFGIRTSLVGVGHGYSAQSAARSNLSAGNSRAAIKTSAAALGFAYSAQSAARSNLSAGNSRAAIKTGATALGFAYSAQSAARAMLSAGISRAVINTSILLLPLVFGQSAQAATYTRLEAFTQ